MRKYTPFFLVLFICMVASACGDKPIGQPCAFNWLSDSEGNLQCGDYPKCHPLQESGSGPATLNNLECPKDCYQTDSLLCDYLMCVSTSVESDFQHMNGQCYQCSDDPGMPGCNDCSGTSIGCMGYCTKSCLTDAGCPPGYECSAMAPFGGNLKCEDDTKWGTECSDTCLKAGESPPGSTKTCPDSVAQEQEESPFLQCGDPELSKCCTCICYEYCSLGNLKICRKDSWDEDTFPKATTAVDPQACETQTN